MKGSKKEIVPQTTRKVAVSLNTILSSAVFIIVGVTIFLLYQNSRLQKEIERLKRPQEVVPSTPTLEPSPAPIQLTEEELLKQVCLEYSEENEIKVCPDNRYAVTLKLLGGGIVYLDSFYRKTSCPVVGPDSISDECKTLVTLKCKPVVCPKIETPEE